MVYRSKFEQQNDEFWFNHTELIFWLVLGVIGLMALTRLWAYTMELKDRWALNRKSARRGRSQL